MELSVCKLTVELLEDWLAYFDNDAFSDNEHWYGCYCMCYHWDEELEKQREWDTGRECAAFNRKQAINFIKSGRMEGYLTYVDGKVVGWCNANLKKAYADFPGNIPDQGEKIKSIVCFSVSPQYRGRGIAATLLDYICEDAKSAGFDVVEAYPFAHNENHAYHGPLSIYQKSGFVLCDEYDGCMIYRKRLNP